MAGDKLINLDDLTIFKNFDQEDMLKDLHLFADSCQKAWEMSQVFNLPEEYSKINKIVILGMGGSAIGGDLVGSLAEVESTVPVFVCRDYMLPKFVDTNSLVLASSYSGMTEETLTTFEQALNSPAKKLAITTGGKLKSICEDKGIPLLVFDYKAQPRAALPYSFFILLGLFQKLGIIKNKHREVSECISNLKDLSEKINETVPLDQNPAKQLARELYGNLAVIYGAGITSEAAHRWKTQINENSKMLAYYEVFPELNHNAIVGYSFPREIIQKTMVVILDSDFLHERVKLRLQITRDLLQQAGIKFKILKAEGKTALSQMMELVLFGDYVSYYAAMLNQVDPSTIKSINYLKNNLAAH